MKVHELLEMSMIIPPYRQIDDIENKQIYDTFVNILNTTSTYSKVSDVSDDIELYLGNNHYMAINNKIKQVVYTMDYEVHHNSILKQYVTQTWVWSNPEIQTNLPTKLFFTLLDKYNTIVCDEKQTILGRDFWVKQMNKAFQDNLNVYFFNFKINLLVKLTNADDIEKYNKIYSAWNATKLAQTKVFVISKLDL